MTKPETAEMNAVLLVDAVKRALASGSPHYDKAGRRLTTVVEVLEALLRDGVIEFGDQR